MSRLKQGLGSLIGLGAEAYENQRRKSSQGQPAGQQPQGYNTQQYPNPGQGQGYNAQQYPGPGQGQGYPPQQYSSQQAGAPPPYSQAPPSQTGQHEHDDDDSDYQSDEEEWAKEDVQESLNGGSAAYNSQLSSVKGADAYVDAFLQLYPQQGWNHPGRLTHPVVIPQQRPGKKTRGWVRAYAPELHSCGIGEQQFLDFLSGFGQAIKQNGWFNVVNASVILGDVASAAAVAPSAIVTGTALAVELAVDAGKQTYMTKKTNTYLDRMNEQFLKLHGLYALIMTFKPGAAAIETSDVNAPDHTERTTNMISQRESHSTSSYRDSSGKTGEAELPFECARLVFPELERASDEQKLNAFQRAGKFSSDYFDRRKQAEFVSHMFMLQCLIELSENLIGTKLTNMQKIYDNPDSRLNVQAAPQMNSAWSDPHGAAYQGGLLTLLSGGRADGPLGRRKKKKAASGKQGVVDRRRERKAQGKSPLGFVKKAVKENVLYLMIVNMPSQQALQEAAQKLQMQKQ